MLLAIQVALSPIIEKNAAEYQLDPKMISAIITQESNWDKYAVRYEEKYTYLLNPFHYSTLLNISLTTEIQVQKMSWGLGQLMGAVARELGFQGPLASLCDENINIEYICKLLSQIKKIAKTIEEVFAIYNGGYRALAKTDGHFRNQSYVDSVMKHYLEG